MQHNAHSEYHAPQSIWGIVVENLHTIFDLNYTLPRFNQASKVGKVVLRPLFSYC